MDVRFFPTIFSQVVISQKSILTKAENSQMYSFTNFKRSQTFVIIPISLQPNAVNPWIFQTINNFRSNNLNFKF